MGRAPKWGFHRGTYRKRASSKSSASCCWKPRPHCTTAQRRRMGVCFLPFFLFWSSGCLTGQLTHPLLEVREKDLWICKVEHCVPNCLSQFKMGFFLKQDGSKDQPFGCNKLLRRCTFIIIIIASANILGSLTSI